MNFLAHAYLSFDDPEILVGNMISDFVKGSAKLRFSGNIQKGIMLHREIDNFTDVHPATKKAKEIFRPAYRLYSGAVMDVIYDHYLATDLSIFDETSLRAFTSQTYRILDQYTAILPSHFMHIFTYMKTDDWLYHYREREGIRKSLAGLIRRAVYLSESDTAYHLFLEQYIFLNECYSTFIGDVKEYAKQKLKES